ncbi:hypothetical protein [Arthrobacter sp. MMS24-S77]
MSRRRSAATAGVMLLGLLIAAPASAAGDGPDLILTHGGSNPPAVLAPGSTSTWSIGVTSRAVTLHDLRLRLRAEEPLGQLSASDSLARHVTVDVRSCPGAWVAGACPSGENTVISATTLASLSDTGMVSLANPDGGIPAGVELMLSVTLSPAAGNGVQGLSTRIAARVDALGEPVSARDFPAMGLADTGFRLGIFAVMGLGAVLAGVFASRFAGVRAAARARTVATGSAAAPARGQGVDR